MVNKIIVVGRLGKDPEIKYVGDQAVCTFSVATDRKWKSKAGEEQKETTWFEIEVWGKQAEPCAKYLSKGRQAYVEGRVKVDRWEKEGVKREKWKVLAESVVFVGEKGSADAPSTASAPIDPDFA